VLLIGADPEFFVRRKRHFVSGHPFDCGTKYAPMQTKHGFVQVDGVALECNVTPAADVDTFVKNCRGVMGDLDDHIKLLDKDCHLVARPSIFLGTRYLKRLPEEARNLGCTPDFNAYTNRTNPRPDADSPVRTGSGHIHLGWTENENPRGMSHFAACARLVRELDIVLGLDSLRYDTDWRRRQLYGRAGAFRPKPYGCEYRVLSNFWLDNDTWIKRIFKGAHYAFESHRSGYSLCDEFGTVAQDIIDNNIATWPDAYPEIADILEEAYAGQ
jgi:hypothetical protein